MTKSFSPAGMAVKAYFGRGARTFGNPDGATRGGGAFAAGGANPNGPDQGGGGAPTGFAFVTFQIVLGFQSTGPYTNPAGSMAGYSSAGQDFEPIHCPSGVACGNVVPAPTFVDGLQLVVWGDASSGPNDFWSVCLPGVVPQDFFNSIDFQDNAGTPWSLLTADALFNSTYNQLPDFTVWTWPFSASFPANAPGGGSDIAILWGNADLVIQATAGSIGGGGPLVGFSGNNGALGPGFTAGVLQAGRVPWFPSQAPIEGIGDSSLSPFGSAQFVVSVFGGLAQNAFTSVEVVGTGHVLTTASASNFDNGGGCGPATIWAWPLQNLVAGTQYAFRFT